MPSTVPAGSPARGGCIGASPIVIRADTASSADLARVRTLTGAVLYSPKQPQPRSGRVLRSSTSAQVATRNKTATRSRTALAGSPRPSRPAVTISPMPSTNSVAHKTTATGRRRCTGNKAVGPSAAAIVRVRSTRTSFAEHPPSSIADSSGICASSAAVSRFISGRSRWSH